MADDEKDVGWEIQRASLHALDVKAAEVKAGRMFMVQPGAKFRFPIHPEPGADHKISKLLHQSEVIVVSKDEDPNNGDYLKTVLPIPGWVRKTCIEDGMLVEVDKETLRKLVTLEDNVVFSGCDKFLRNCGCLRGCYTTIRKHPLYLLAIFSVIHLMAETMKFLDFITDLLVADALARSKQNTLFMLTVVFMLAPYYIAWAAVFGELQKVAMASTADNEHKLMAQDSNAGASNESDAAMEEEEDDDEESSGGDKDRKPKASAPDKKIQLFVILFAIAPIGVVILLLLDIYLLLEDLFIKPVYLWLLKRPIRPQSHAEKGYKKLRRVSEVVAETICQTVLQTIIVISKPDGMEGEKLNVVYVSLVISVLVLVLWIAVLTKEAKDVGLRFYEYVTVILQGSFNFVPYLPAIERGKKEFVNWANFRFDSHSVGLVSKALISPECKLIQIKVSADSLRKLSHHECKFLGQMLADSPKDSVKVVFSRSRQDIEELFTEFDTDHSRTFDYVEFLQLCCALRQNDDGVVSAKDVADIFMKLADVQRHEVYLTDLLRRIESEEERLPVLDYDSPVMYALKEKKQKLLTFMMAAKVCDDATFEYYTTTLVTDNRHQEALMMTEEKGVPIVVELISAQDLPINNQDNTSDPYASVTMADKVKRTDTIYKTLSPTWNQPLLFVLPFEDIPENMGGRSELNRNRGTSRSPQNQLRRRQSHRHQAQHQRHTGVGKKGVVGSTTSRLEINFKIYDYEEQDEDFFLGSYKHFIKWDVQELQSHQEFEMDALKGYAPTQWEKKLNNHGKGGSFKFRIYTATLQYYVMKRNTRLRKKKRTVTSTPNAETHHD